MAGTKYTRKPVKKVAKKNQSITQTGVKKKSVLSRALKNTAKGLGKGAMAVASMSPAGKGVKAAKLASKGAKIVKKKFIDKPSRYAPVEKAGKIRDKIRNKSVAQEVRELKQTAAGKNMTPKQLKDRVALDRKDAKIPEPKPRYSKSQRDYAKANKEARQKQIDNAKVSREKGVKVTKYPPRDKIVKDSTARPRRYLGRGEPIGGMKKGGAVKSKCKIDGIAQRGRTRAKRK